MGDHFENEQKVLVLTYLIAIIDKVLNDNEPDYYARKTSAFESISELEYPNPLDYHVDLYCKDDFVKRIDVGSDISITGGITNFYRFTVNADDHTEHTWTFKSSDVSINEQDPWMTKCVQFRSLMWALLSKLSGNGLQNEIDRLSKYLPAENEEYKVV